MLFDHAVKRTNLHNFCYQCHLLYWHIFPSLCYIKHLSKEILKTAQIRPLHKAKKPTSYLKIVMYWSISSIQVCVHQASTKLGKGKKNFLLLACLYRSVNPVQFNCFTTLSRFLRFKIHLNLDFPAHEYYYLSEISNVPCGMNAHAQ